MALSFHHVGVACRDLSQEVERLKSIGYRQDGETFVDPIQGVQGAFLVGGGPRLEILRPLNEKGVLTPWLNAGTKLYHLAYTVGGSLSNEIEVLRKEGAKLVVSPVSAVAFQGAHICFLMLPNMLLVELIGGSL